MPRASLWSSSSRIRRARLVAAVRRREDDLGVDRVGVAAGELEQRRALAGCGRATAEAGERSPAGGVLERPEPVPLCVVVEDREVADLAGRATGSAVDVAADQDTAADADADLDVEGVVDPLRGATPALGQDGEMHLVVDQHRAGEHRLQPAREPDPLPAAELGRQRDPARYGVDDAWRADADRLQAAPVDRGTRRGLRPSRHRRDSRRVSAVCRSLRARPAADGSDHLAREVGDDDQHLVRADVDAEHMARGRRES